jgi:hypothetical protein
VFRLCFYFSEFVKLVIKVFFGSGRLDGRVRGQIDGRELIAAVDDLGNINCFVPDVPPREIHP